ncbi:LysR family transcriptional regulator [Alkalicoccobacillus murimartini]|uniref:DNA-binding transcriptional LysR family regulator n=1 Tax=Alkalicoccobacillus murimartini TaxID=171685 RepID=A0ABT9YCX1_9BACI|nr:LysR family transcriptional regulator [Alkalicoccobacillus murimartini]MDQ0205703.1 DNA-binding transcriptional LysR family regulator [Alkalicoccobacillus murimartini]
MEWHHFEYFQTLARTEHMTKSAELLSVSQPALSRSIQRLEEELGVPLFDRKGRSIVLNKYGKLFLERVNRITFELNEAKKELAELLDPNSGEVTLGFLHTLGPDFIPVLIRSFMIRFPKIKLNLVQNNSHTLTKLIDAGQIDVCLLSEVPLQQKNRWELLKSEELFITLPTSHPLANEVEVKLKQVEHDSFIFLKEGYSLRHTTDQIFHTIGISPTVTFEGEEVQTIAGLIASGLGISLLPKIAEAKENKIVQIPVQSTECRRKIGVCWNEDHHVTATSQKLISHILETYKHN